MSFAGLSDSRFTTKQGSKLYNPLLANRHPHVLISLPVFALYNRVLFNHSLETVSPGLVQYSLSS
jgi:hypothetical protein